MKVEAQIRLDKDGIALRGSKTTLEKLRKKFLKDQEFVILKAEFSDDELYKSYPQLSYFHNEIAQKAIQGYQNWGLSIRTREQAAAKLCIDVGFVEHISDSDGNIIATYPKRLSKSKVSDMSWLIEHSSIFVRVEMQIDIMTPEEWKAAKKIK